MWSIRSRPNSSAILFWGLVGVLMWIGMPALFAYRGWKTRRMLEAGDGTELS